MNATKHWNCDQCGTRHDDSDDAAKCCPPAITMVFVCSKCDEPYLDEGDADACCKGEAQAG